MFVGTEGMRRMDVGKRIAALRRKKGWTTNGLANRCGLSQSFLRSVELGQKGISVENLGLICDALGISLRDFFDWGLAADPLGQRVERLTPRQRRALSDFLDAMLADPN